MNEQVLGHFLRYKRTTATLNDFDITPTSRRRTPGLTRDEVAALAHVSSDWYTRIEQGRAKSQVSREVLLALCQALRFSNAETHYVFHLAGQLPPALATTAKDLTDLLMAQLPRPAYVLGAHFQIEQTNPSYARLYQFTPAVTALENNLIWRLFHQRAWRQLFQDWDQVVATQVARFRQVYSQDAAAVDLYQVFQAVQTDPAFQKPWQRLTVADLTPQRLLLNSQWGNLYLVETPLIVPTTQQVVMIQTPGDAATATRLARINGRDGAQSNRLS